MSILKIVVLLPIAFVLVGTLAIVNPKAARKIVVESIAKNRN